MYGFQKYWTFAIPLLFTLFFTVENKNLEVGKRSDLACEKFANSTPTYCPRQFLTGGSKASPKEFPPAALIGIFEKETNQTTWFCGGTLISERFVLTASHCAGSGDPNIVRLGDLDYSTTEDDVGLQEFSVSRVIPHEKYDYASYYDIMLLELNGTVVFTDYVQPACILTPKLMNYNTGVFWAVGWGRVNSSRFVSSHLRRMELKQMENCSEIAKYTMSLERGLEESTQFCTHGKTNGMCIGDSGGPLLATFPHYEANDRCLYIVAGVVSRIPIDCGKYDYPNINTNVTAFIQFIENYVWPETN